uniref:Uncharacterized protein n=1 Tax=Glossina austeni TaxID=7395 RepID=A0A1A9V2S7_GLOAU
MILSAVFCVAAVTESSWLLEIGTNSNYVPKIFISSTKLVLASYVLYKSCYYRQIAVEGNQWSYQHGSLPLIDLIFQGIVSIMAYILSQKLRDKQQHIVCSLCSGESLFAYLRY